MPPASFTSIMPHEAKVRSAAHGARGSPLSARFREELLDEPGRCVNLVRHQYIFRELTGEQFLNKAIAEVKEATVFGMNLHK